jgi:hypothetical protein
VSPVVGNIAPVALRLRNLERGVIAAPHDVAGVVPPVAIAARPGSSPVGRKQVGLDVALARPVEGCEFVGPPAGVAAIRFWTTTDVPLTCRTGEVCGALFRGCHAPLGVVQQQDRRRIRRAGLAIE